MGLNVRFEDEELPKLQQLLLRAMNCWDPKETPPWANELFDRVQARMDELKRREIQPAEEV